MISRNMEFSYHISPHCIIQSRDIYTRIHTSPRAYRICTVPVAEREIDALSYPFPRSHARCSSQFHFDPSRRANPIRYYTRVVRGRIKDATCYIRVQPSFAEFLSNNLCRATYGHQNYAPSIEHANRQRSNIRIFLLKYKIEQKIEFVLI